MCGCGDVCDDGTGSAGSIIQRKYSVMAADVGHPSHIIIIDITFSAPGCTKTISPMSSGPMMVLWSVVTDPPVRLHCLSNTHPGGFLLLLTKTFESG